MWDALRVDSATSVSLIVIAVSVLLSYSAYFAQQPIGFNSYLAIASSLFWASLLLILLRGPLASTSRSFAIRFSKSRRSVAVFAVYISVHLLAYGFILEEIVAAFFPQHYSFPVTFSAIISSIPLYPPTFLNSIFGMFVYPSLAFTIPPVFGLELSLYSLAMALVIAILVTTNVEKAFQLKSVCTLRRRSVAYFALPIIGVVGGASCCLSLPIFIAFLAAPAAALASPSIVTAYYVTYFLFPPATAVALKLNLDSISGLEQKILKAQSS